MPALSRDQFWKQNPNQMALPGLEEHAHAGATLLAKGYRVQPEHDTEAGPDVRTLRALTPEGNTASALHWGADPVTKGEIMMVETHPAHQGRGVASALYGLGRQMAQVKPEHSPNRSDAGEGWAHSVSKKYGGKVPPLERPY